MTNTNFFIVGKHPVIEALKNPQRKVLRLFLTEESKKNCLLYTSPSPRDGTKSRMPSSA